MGILFKFIARAAIYRAVVTCYFYGLGTQHLNAKTANPSLVTVYKLVLRDGIISQHSRTMLPSGWKLYLNRYLMPFFY